jgi:hypothetical protein
LTTGIDLLTIAGLVDGVSDLPDFALIAQDIRPARFDRR